jgi:hypothetical protein
MTNTRANKLNHRFLALLALTILTLPVAAIGCGDSADAETNNGQGDSALVSEDAAFEAHLTPDPDPPVTGDNTIAMHLMDPDGEPISGATVTVEPWMPAHGHGSSEEPVVEASADMAGMYTISNVVFTMPGHWEVRIDVAHQGDSDRFVAEYDVQ